MPRDAARCHEMQREAARCLFLQQDASLCGCLCCLLTGWLGGVRSQLKVASVALGDARCVRRRGECARACVRCGLWQACCCWWASVLCVRRCAGVRCARAVRVCVLESRVSLRVLRARRRVLCAVLCCAPVCGVLRRRLGWQGCAVGCGALRVVARLPDGVRRPRSPPDRVVGGPGRGHAVCAACEAVCAAGAYVSVRRGTRVCVHAAGAGGRGGRRGLTAVRRRLVLGVARAGAQRGLAAIALPRRKKNPIIIALPPRKKNLHLET